jgi:hypothetical protein
MKGEAPMIGGERQHTTAFTTKGFQMRLTALFLFACSASALIAQTPPKRAFQAVSVPATVGTFSGMIHLLPAANPVAGQMAKVDCVLQGNVPVMTATMPFEYVGGVTQLENGHYVISGASTSTPPVGHLVRIEIDASAGTILTRESMTFPGLDLFGVAYDPAQPFLLGLDRQARAVVYGLLVWPPSAVTDPVLPVTWSTAVNAQQCPGLLSDYPIMDFEDGKFLVYAHRLADPSQIMVSGGGWVALPPATSHANEWVLDASESHTGPVQVKSMAPIFSGSPGFSVVSTKQGITVASGSVTGVNQWTVLPAPSAFYDYPGFPYQVTGALSSASRTVYPLLRYGASTTSGSIIPRRSNIVASSVYVGSPDASFLLATENLAVPAGQQLPQPQSVNSYLLIGLGFRGPQAPPDPIVGTGSSARLQYISAFEILSEQRWRGNVLAASLPIPNEAFLVDCVVLAQWAVIAPGSPATLVYSDIVGVRVSEAPPSSALAAQGGGASPNGATMTTAQKRAVFRNALNTHPRHVAPNSNALQALWAHRQVN